MISLKSVFMRLLSRSFWEVLRESGVTEADIEQLQDTIATQVFAALLKTGREVVDDYQPKP